MASKGIPTVLALEIAGARPPADSLGRTAADVLENGFLRAKVNDPRLIEAATSRQLLERLTDEDRSGLRAVAVVRTSDEPADEIVSYAKEHNIDLIIVGTHGRQGSRTCSSAASPSGSCARRRARC